MSQTDRTAVESSLERRVTELERAADQGRFARLYGPIAVTLVALSALPPFQDIGDGAVTVSFGTLWDMARTNAGDPAVFGLFLLGILVALLVVASFGVAGTGTLAGIVVTSGLVILMLLTKPGTGEPPPELSGVGVVGLILVICTAALATVHAIQLARRRPRPALAVPSPRG